MSPPARLEVVLGRKEGDKGEGTDWCHGEPRWRNTGAVGKHRRKTTSERVIN